ncbi:hypothetical protein L484_021298 [Morus notabilis]|uniref:Uncharacterized protein n=1 Tax=Morus notabilis TaxID=981085 RepID=W9SWH6_9ROSA|nr:hypothetical protein L484_021298 [Morus notabilis]
MSCEKSKDELGTSGLARLKLLQSKRRCRHDGESSLHYCGEEHSTPDESVNPPSMSALSDHLPAAPMSFSLDGAKPPSFAPPQNLSTAAQ